ncbi:class I SAM-dependent methyltransferase [Abyssisolibacter fermentans]|uniref:class I SAM-dependent methyltransferase n=1 Tax=Abyssisolibacter fermentans TaxID=1766203 RepID=UPI0008376383|nr:class I SAM-dependent methyltransferase [Abyssisolibacter fermentans]
MDNSKRIFKEKKIWNKLASKYDKQCSIYDDAYKLSIENSNKILQNDFDVLEIACGTGLVTFGIAETVKKIIAIDISNEMIIVAKEKANKLKINNVEFKVADGYNLNYKDESFDAILLFNALHIVKEPDMLLNEIYRLLKPNGFLLMATDCYAEPVKIKQHIMLTVLKIAKVLGIIPYLSYYKKEDIDDYLIRHNFVIKERDVLNKEPVNYYVAASKKVN